MVKEIKDKSDVECHFYQSAEDITNPRELSAEKKMQWYLMICYFKNKTRVNSIMSEEDTAMLIDLAPNYFTLPRQTIRQKRISYVCFPKT